MVSTTAAKKVLRKIWPICFWLLLWHVAARLMNQPILLVSPWDALKRLSELVALSSFWYSILFSLGRILLGFALSAIFGIGLAASSSRFKGVRELLSPLIAAVKAVPVASFVILVLFWTNAKNLSVVISLLIGFPVIYTNALNGFDHLDRQLNELAEVFHVPFGKRLLYITTAQLMPHLRAGLTLAMGMCWKSGIAAQVIGIPRGSVGEALYQSKIYLDTSDLFGWTLVIILLSVLCEKAISLLLKLLERGTVACRRS